MLRQVAVAAPAAGLRQGAGTPPAACREGAGRVRRRGGKATRLRPEEAPAGPGVLRFDWS